MFPEESSMARAWESALPESRIHQATDSFGLCNRPNPQFSKGAGGDHSICAPFPTTVAQKAEILWNPEQPEFPHQHSAFCKRCHRDSQAMKETRSEKTPW
ncbi:uncharacterized [Tachysurus ichikawai]